MATPGASVAGTPLRGGSVGPGATPGRTPVRDALGLNDPDALAPAEVCMVPFVIAVGYGRSSTDCKCV